MDNKKEETEICKTCPAIKLANTSYQKPSIVAEGENTMHEIMKYMTNSLKEHMEDKIL